MKKQLAKTLKDLTPVLCALAFVVLCSEHAHAAGGGGDMPWEGPLDRITNSLSGPVARGIGVMAIVAAGLGLAFGEGGGGMRKVLWVVFGLSITFSATTTFLDIVGSAAGLAF